MVVIVFGDPLGVDYSKAVDWMQVIEMLILRLRYWTLNAEEGELQVVALDGNTGLVAEGKSDLAASLSVLEVEEPEILVPRCNCTVND